MPMNEGKNMPARPGGGRMPARPRRIASAQGGRGGRHSKSLCDSRFTTHSKSTTA